MAKFANTLFENTIWTIKDGDWYVSTTGSDIEPIGDGSPLKPFLTVKKAFEKASNGDKIIVGPDQYVVDRDSGSGGRSGFLLPAMCATVSDVSLSGTQIIDGYQTKAGDRVLVWREENNVPIAAVKNGIYTVSTANWIRTEDANGVGDLYTGMIIHVALGNEHGNSFFRLENTGSIVPNVTAIEFSKLPAGYWGKIEGNITLQEDLTVLVQGKINELKDNVPTDGNSLKKLYDMIQQVVGVSAKADTYSQMTQNKSNYQDQQNIYVDNAFGAPGITTDNTWAIFKYLGGTTDDFIKIAEQESIDVVISTGDILKDGIPEADQVAVWTGDGTLKGVSEITFNNNELSITEDLVTHKNGGSHAEIKLTESLDHAKIEMGTKWEVATKPGSTTPEFYIRNNESDQNVIHIDDNDRITINSDEEGEGMYYSKDYLNPQKSDRWIPDKGYVDSAIAPLRQTNITTGTNSSYVITNLTLSDYSSSLIYKVRFHVANAANPTLKINTLPSTLMVTKNGDPLEAGYLTADSAYLFSYEIRNSSPVFQLLGDDRPLSGTIVPRQVNAKWEPHLTTFYYIDIEGAFEISIKSDAETGNLLWKRREKPGSWQDNGGNYFDLTAINTWGQSQTGKQIELAAVPANPDFDTNNDGTDDLVTVGCIIEIRPK
ncbi:MAG: hypothetical protein WBA74_09515 [Cyclobacteriaceae bacterium]